MTMTHNHNLKKTKCQNRYQYYKCQDCGIIAFDKHGKLYLSSNTPMALYEKSLKVFSGYERWMIELDIGKISCNSIIMMEALE